MSGFLLMVAICLLSSSPWPLAVLAQRETVRIAGAGASFPEAVYTEWMSSYKSHRAQHQTVEMSYEGVGSGSGRRRIIDKDPTIIYGASDSLLSEEEMESSPDLTLFPSMAGAVVVGYNIPEMADSDKALILSLETLTGIYNGSIRFWNDSSLQELNPDVYMPNKSIMVLARADSSGTTDIFTKYLSKSPDWANGSFKQKAGWGDNAVTFFAHQSRGMTGLIMSFSGSIGYVSIGEALASQLKYADIVNSYGQLVTAAVSSVQAVMDEAVAGRNPRLDAVLTDSGSPRGYPIAGFTYVLVYSTGMENCAEAKELIRYIDWIISSPTADKDCEEKEMTPLSAKLKSLIRSTVLEKASCGGENLWQQALEDIKEENKTESKWQTGTSAAGTVLACVLLAAVVRYLVYSYKYNKMLNRNEWEISIDDIVFFHSSRSGSSGQCRFTLWPSITSLTEIDDMDEGYMMLNHILQWPGKLNGLTIGLRLFELNGLKTIRQQDKALLLSFKDTISHLNVLKFCGLTQIESDWYTVSEYCAKGRLTDVLKDKKLILNNDFKFSLSYDIITGVSYLHSKGIIHGSLRSSACLIDFRWTVKIADWEFLPILTRTKKQQHPLLQLRKNPDEIGENEASFHSYWTAPEVLQSDYKAVPTAPMDIYSYSIVVQEIFTREDPFVEHANDISPLDMVKAIINNKLRPSHHTEVPGTIRHVQECAWAEEPGKRPTAEQLIKMILAVHSFKRSVVDAMMEAAEEYSVSLEEKLSSTRRELSQASDKLGAYNNRLVLPIFKVLATSMESGIQADAEDDELHLSKSVVNRNNPVQRISACIVCIKCNYSIAQQNLWSTLNNLDMMLEHFSSVYNAHRIDIGTGMFLLVFSSPSKSTMPAVNAARLCLQMVQCINELFNDDDGSGKVFGYQIAIHKGNVFACYLNNHFPKSYVIGENIEFVNALVEKSKVNRILVSKTYHDALDTVAKGVFKLEKNQHHTNGHVNYSPAYWLLSEGVITSTELTTEEVHIPVIV